MSRSLINRHFISSASHIRQVTVAAIYGHCFTQYSVSSPRSIGVL